MKTRRIIKKIFKKFFSISFCLANLCIFFSIHYKFVEKDAKLKKMIRSIKEIQNYNLLAEAEISYLLNPNILKIKITDNYKIPTYSEIFFIDQQDKE